MNDDLHTSGERDWNPAVPMFRRSFDLLISQWFLLDVDFLLIFFTLMPIIKLYAAKKEKVETNTHALLLILISPSFKTQAYKSRLRLANQSKKVSGITVISRGTRVKRGWDCGPSLRDMLTNQLRSRWLASATSALSAIWLIPFCGALFF